MTNNSHLQTLCVFSFALKIEMFSTMGDAVKTSIYLD